MGLPEWSSELNDRLREAYQSAPPEKSEGGSKHTGFKAVYDLLKAEMGESPVIATEVRIITGTASEEEREKWLRAKYTASDLVGDLRDNMEDDGAMIATFPALMSIVLGDGTIIEGDRLQEVAYEVRRAGIEATLGRLERMAFLALFPNP